MAQTPLQRLVLSLQGTHGLDPAIRQALVAWLQGKPLSDPRAVEYLTHFYSDPRQAVADAGAAGTTVGPITVGAGQAGNAPGVQGPQVPVGPAVPGLGAGLGGAGQALGATTPLPTGSNNPGKLNAPVVPGGGEPPPVRSVPQGGGQATRAAQAGQAAGGLAAQWAANRSQNVAPMNPVPTPSAAPTQQTPQKAGGSTMSGVIPGGGGISDVQGLALGPGADNDFRLRQALQAAGVDPYSRGLRTQYLMQVLSKPLAAAGETLGLGGGGADPTTYLDNLKNVVQSFITAGRSGFGEQRAQAQKIMGDPGFNDVLGNLDTKGQSQQYQNLLQMMYGGENPAVQSAAQNVFGDTMNKYQDNQIMGDKPFSGMFSQYAQQDPKSTIARILSGLYGR